MLSIFDVIKRLINTEKATMLRSEKQCVFLVDSLATKMDVKRACELLFDATVVRVMIMNCKKRSRKREIGLNNFKKAIVRFSDGFNIDSVLGGGTNA